MIASNCGIPCFIFWIVTLDICHLDDLKQKIGSKLKFSKPPSFMRQLKLFLMICVDLVLDAFHLTFGCCVLYFSLFSMEISRKKPEDVYSYGYFYFFQGEFSIYIFLSGLFGYFYPSYPFYIL